MVTLLAVLLAVAPAVGGGRAKITSHSTYYDRKEGMAFFNGQVHVDDEQYQLHADRAYVFMDGTNELSRIVAIGRVAMTNENKRAYGQKATYYRNPGMVVLHGDDSRPAEVREIMPDGDRVVRGRKIKFWTGTQQVEVLDSTITAPGGGNLNGLKGMIGK